MGGRGGRGGGRVLKREIEGEERRRRRRAEKVEAEIVGGGRGRGEREKTGQRFCYLPVSTVTSNNLATK